MIDLPFIAGTIIGSLFTASAFVIIISHARRRPRKEISHWTDEHYQQPPVVTKVTVNRHRSFEL